MILEGWPVLSLPARVFAFGCDCWQLVKPLRAVTPSLTLAMGALFEPAKRAEPSAFLLGAGAAALIYFAVSAFNDVVDAREDAVNDPGRPVVSGRLSSSMALGIAALLALAGVGLSFAVNPVLGLIALASLGLGLFYCLWAKRNLVSYFTLGLTHHALPFLAGAALAGGPSLASLLVAGYLYATITPIIAIKDLKDAAGDLAAGLRTLPAVAGQETASRLVAVGVLFAPLTFWIPGLLLGLSLSFLLAYLAAGLLRAAYAVELWRVPQRERVAQANHGLRALSWCETAAWALG